jgi:hypothetical protein
VPVRDRSGWSWRGAGVEREGWLGEIEGLKVSLAGTEDKIAQIDTVGPVDPPGVSGGSECATRRAAVSPAERAKTGGGVFGSNG